ncbi:MAG: outer membrane lipoprotein chaperone LolA [Gemmatimonadota bacterium]|nr:outer membrane lipoprotein chaperone LolA [Gemmatimonadota bacterium]
MREPIITPIVAALALVTAPLARAQSPEATLARASKAYMAIRSVRASFSQTITNPLTGSSASSAGEVLQRPPRRISVTFTQPAGDRIVADGKTLWIYLPSTNPGQVIRMSAGEGAAGAFDMVSELVRHPQDRYTVAPAGTADVQGHSTHAVTLTPRQSGGTIARATVWVDDDDALTRQFETTDASGVTRRIVITRLVINVAVPRNAFRFTPPTGVRVIEPGSAR